MIYNILNTNIQINQHNIDMINHNITDFQKVFSHNLHAIDHFTRLLANTAINIVVLATHIASFSSKASVAIVCEIASTSAKPDINHTK